MQMKHHWTFSHNNVKCLYHGWSTNKCWKFVTIILYCYMCSLLSDFWLAVTSKDFHPIGYDISVDPARKSLGYQGQSSRVNQEVLGWQVVLKCLRGFSWMRLWLKSGPQVVWMLQAKPGRSDKQQQEQNSTNLGTKWITAHWSEVFATHHLKTEEGAACLTVLAARLPSRKEGKVEAQPSKAGPSNQVSCSLFCLHFRGGNQVTRSVSTLRLGRIQGLSR